MLLSGGSNPAGRGKLGPGRARLGTLNVQYKRSPGRAYLPEELCACSQLTLTDLRHSREFHCQHTNACHFRILIVILLYCVIHNNIPVAVMSARGATWSDEETEALISVWGEETVQAQLEGSRHNHRMYTSIARGLAEKVLATKGTVNSAKKRLKS